MDIKTAEPKTRNRRKYSINAQSLLNLLFYGYLWWQFFLYIDIYMYVLCIFILYIYIQYKNVLFLHITVFKVILRFKQKEYIKRIPPPKKKPHESLHEHHKKESEKKIHELYFSSRHWFWTDSVYSDFDWSGSGGELDSKDRHGGTIQRLQKTPLSFKRIWYPINTLHRTLLKCGY